jgi:hypothetical protein
MAEPTFWDKAQAIDRRWIFLIIAISVIGPLFFDIRMQNPPTEPVEAIFNRIESLPEGSNVLVAFDFDPPSRPELQPMAMSYLRHLAIRGHRVYTMALWPMGQAEARSIIGDLYASPELAGTGECAEGEAVEESDAEPEFPAYIYGTDYVMLGSPGLDQHDVVRAYRESALPEPRPLQETVSAALERFPSFTGADVAGTPLEDHPIMAEMTGLDDVDLVIDISAGEMNASLWAGLGEETELALVAAVPANGVGLRALYPDDLVGILAGAEDSAAYEVLLMEGHPDRYPTLAGFAALINLGYPPIANDAVRAVYDRIESLPPGANVLLSFQYSEEARSELRPMAKSFLRHLAIGRHQVYTMALWPDGRFEAQTLLAEVFGATPEVFVPVRDVVEGDEGEDEEEEEEGPEFPAFCYGRDYLMLGFRPGNQGVIQVVLNDFRGMYTSDYAGTPIDEIPMMEDIVSLRDMDLILNISAGYPGLKEWIQFGGDPSGVPVAGGVTAVSAPLLYPYYPNQMFGIMGGIKAAAEYETLLMQHYGEGCQSGGLAPGSGLGSGSGTGSGTGSGSAPRCGEALASSPDWPGYSDIGIFDGIGRMGPQTFAHIVIVLFIVIGNIGFFATLRGRSKERLKSVRS